MEWQMVLLILLLTPAILKAETLHSTNESTPSNQQYKETMILVIPSRQTRGDYSGAGNRAQPILVVEPNDIQNLKPLVDFPESQYTHLPDKHLRHRTKENELINMVFTTMRSKTDKQLIEPLHLLVKSTQLPHTKIASFKTLNSEQDITSTNLFDPGSSQRNHYEEKKRFSQKYRLIPYEFDTQGEILKDGPAILNDAFKIIINPQKESIRQRENDYHNIDNYFDLESVAKEREQARLKTKVIADSPPVLVQSDINISRKIPIVVLRTVKVPILSPYLVPVPEIYPMPQPYAVPVEKIRPYAVQLIKTEKIEVERPVPVEVEKHVHTPVVKKQFVKVERPYNIDKIVPVEVKREVPYEVPLYNLAKYSIIKHLWDK